MFNLRRGWSGGHSHDRGPNFIDFEPFWGYSGIPPLLIKGSKIVKIGPFCMEAVALPAEKRNARGFGGFGGRGGWGGILGFFGGVVRKLMSDEDFYKNLRDVESWECPPDHPLLRLNGWVLLLICSLYTT